ncbi:hypothetical protein GW17_00028278, partial [Ensete ventricosum]
HPDKNPDPESRKLFVKIANAYEILKDEATREQYDYAIAHPEEVILSADWYADRPLSGGIVKIDRRRSIEEEKGKRKKKEEEEKYLARVPSPPAGRPRALPLAGDHGRPFSPCGERSRRQIGRPISVGPILVSLH